MYEGIQMDFYQEQLKRLSEHKSTSPLDGIVRGIEKENLRVDSHGHYVTTPHPKALGSALTHPFLTTDFSESLLECVTPPVVGREALFSNLENSLAWVVQTIQQQDQAEFLWPFSMPCLQTQQQVEQVPLANYGSSNSAQMKRVYRKGLVSRYGNAMQLIAGIHYNISYPAQLIQQLGSLPGFDDCREQSLISQRYMGLIRNFIRNQWVLAYLFGASPACFSASLRKGHVPRYLHESSCGAYAGDNACSLRLGDLGYHNSAQASIQLGFQCVEKYAKDLLMATQMPDSRLLDSMIKDKAGNYLQLNRNLLQLENEYYFNIRPKPNPTASAGERPAVALYNHGVEYIEFRGLDLDPLNPLGLSPVTSAFCDLFLFYLMLTPSPVLSNMDKTKGACNLSTVVECGRHPQCKVWYQGEQVGVKSAINQMLDEMEPLAQWMDSAEPSSNGSYQNGLRSQREVVKGDALNLSGRFMACWQDSHLSLEDFLCEQQMMHASILRSHSLPEDLQQQWKELAARSLQEQADHEDAESMSFEDYLGRYFSQQVG
jgi:glutamate--cysteine ligase